MQPITEFLVNNRVNKHTQLDLYTVDDTSVLKENTFIKFYREHDYRNYIIIKVKEYEPHTYLRGYYTISYKDDFAMSNSVISVGNGWGSSDPLTLLTVVPEFTDNDIKAIELVDRYIKDTYKTGARLDIRNGQIMK